MSGFAEDFDLGAEGGAATPPDALARLQTSVDELLEMEKIVEQMEEDLKAAKATLQSLRTGRIPDLMNEIGMPFLVRNGKSVELTDFVSGSLPKDPERRAQAIKWLENKGAGGLMRTEVSVEFGRNQHNEALSIAGELRDKGLAPTVASTIAPMTLQKFARDKLKAGEEIDFEILGLYTGKVVKVKDSKK